MESRAERANIRRLIFCGLLAMSILNLSIDLPEWYHSDGPLNIDEVAEAHCRLAIRMAGFTAPDAKRGVDGEVCEANDRIALGPRGRRRGAQGLGPRAQHASSTDFARLSERSGRRPRSEFGARPHTPSTAEQSGPSRTASVGSPFLW